MKKRKYIWILSSFLAFHIVGCTTENINSEGIPTPTIEISTEKFTTTPIVENKENIKTPTATILPSPTDMPMPTIVEFSAKDFNSFNRILSMEYDFQVFGQSLFCVDGQTGVTYFVNQGKDYYLYQIKDDKVELVLSMPVKELYTYQGLLYFMIEDYDIYELKEMHNGDIYCYNPETKMVELIYATGIIEGSKQHRLTVEESGIYFSYEKEKEGGIFIHYSKLPFGETEPVQDEKFITMKGWKDYLLSFNPNLILESRTEREDGTREIIELPASRIRFCVVGDMLYSSERTYISCINLETGEKTGYDFLEILKEVQGKNAIENAGFRIIESFVITQEAIWLTTGSYLYSMNLQSGEVTYAYIVDKNNRPFTITMLYTNGKEVYGIDYLAKQDKKVVHILTDEIEENNNFNRPIIKVEELTE